MKGLSFGVLAGITGGITVQEGHGGVLACLWTYAPLPRFCMGKSDQVVDADQGPPSGMNFNLLINHNAPMPLFLFLLFYCALSLCFPTDP